MLPTRVNGGFVLRYPLFAGVPAQKPDMRYDHATEPIATGADGTFYAGVPFDCCEAVQKIVAFGPFSNQPARRIALPYVQSDGTEALAMTIDGNDYIYVGYAPLFSGARVHRTGAPIDASKLPAAGVAVYAPAQHGGGPPVQAFQVRAVTSPSQVDEESIAFAPDGDLDVLVDDYPREVISFSNPLTNPQVARELQLPANSQANGLTALPAGDDIYVLGSAASGNSNEVDVYRDRAHGSAGPVRSFDLSSYAYGLSIRGDIVYSILGQHSVAGFAKGATGSPAPIFTLALPTAGLAIATGP